MNKPPSAWACGRDQPDERGVARAARRGLRAQAAERCRDHLDRATMLDPWGAAGFAALGDLFTKKAEDALLRGLVENPESTALRERIERLRAARA